MNTVISDLPECYEAFYEPNDPMVHGLSAYHSLANKISHPVEQIQKQRFQLDQKLKNDMARSAYGRHFVEGLAYEQNTIAALHAQGFNSNQISLEISMNRHSTIGPEDFMALPKHQPIMPRVDIHSAMTTKHAALGQ